MLICEGFEDVMEDPISNWTAGGRNRLAMWPSRIKPGALAKESKGKWVSISSGYKTGEKRVSRTSS